MAQVYAIGSNGSGQLGIGHKEDVSVPKPVLFSIPNIGVIDHIVAGGNHTLLLSATKLWSVGDRVGGACGITSASEGSQAQFHLVSLLPAEGVNKSAVAFCAATWEATVIVVRDADGKASRVYSFGIGHKGELGQGELLFRSARAQLLKDFPPPGLEIIDLAASVNHTIAVLSNGDVFGWGNGRKGQLGGPHEIVYTPRKVAGLGFPVVRAVCGREFSCLLGPPDEGQFVILGSDKWNVRSSAPASIPDWKTIGAGWGSLIVLFKDGHSTSWGRDDHGQLTPPNLPLLTELAVGSEHALGLTLDGDVLAWGWGEHGNCGPSTTNGDVKGRWNVIASSKYLPPENKIYKVGAGCATSWVFVSS